MLKALAALAALSCCVAFTVPVNASEPPPAALTLDQAFSLTLDQHPDLRRLPLRQAALAAEADIAAQGPPLVAGVELENALGSGAYGGADGAELSLTLGSVLERPEKRFARIELARSQLAGLDVEAEARRLDVLAEVARRYLDALASQLELDALAASVAQRRVAASAAARRVSAGASPQSVKLGADAALARAELELERSREAAQAARRRLALLWGEADARFDAVAGNLMALPDVPDFAALAAMIERTPELRRFADESRVREARLQLAQSQSRFDLQWQVGLRRLQESDDWALMGGVSIPLGSRRRAQPAIRAAEAELSELSLDREVGQLSLQATLAEAHGRLRVDALTVVRFGDSVLPALERAEGAAGQAYRAGALSYLEWSQLQAELLSARRDRIAAARDFHRALIEIQRLTAEPFVLADGAQTEPTP